MEGVDDAEHLERLNAFDLITPDGQPVRWAMNWLHDADLPDRVYGPRLTLDVCRAAASAGLPVYFYGSTQDTLDHLAERLPTLAPGIEIAGMQPSRFRTSTEDELDRDRGRGARRPARRSAWSASAAHARRCSRYENADRMSMPLMAVGAAFDFHAGLATEPPAWVQRAGLQWAQRLVANPRRLWRRYLILNPRYVAGIIRQRAGRYTPTAGPHPDPRRTQLRSIIDGQSRQTHHVQAQSDLARGDRRRRRRSSACTSDCRSGSIAGAVVLVISEIVERSARRKPADERRTDVEAPSTPGARPESAPGVVAEHRCRRLQQDARDRSATRPARRTRGPIRRSRASDRATRRDLPETGESRLHLMALIETPAVVRDDRLELRAAGRRCSSRRARR